MAQYFCCNDIAKRNQILKHLAIECPEGAEEFFLRAFKKERFLDMKCTALQISDPCIL
jgi:hypothetical protein